MALMVLGHVLAVLEAGGFLRLTLTRFSLPCFAVVTGILLAQRQVSRRRLLQLYAVGYVGAVVGLYVDAIPVFDTVLIIAISLTFWPIARRHPYATMAVSIVQAYTMAGWWYGYQPGHYLSLVILGKLIADSGTYERWRSNRAQLPAFTNRLTILARYPLTLYALHLPLLWALSRS